MDANLAHSNSTDEARRQIDKEIEKLEDQIIVLKSRRNTLAPISQLPPEIICRTFALTISEPLEYDALEWTKVSHVSRHWREVALECPSLWGTPVFSRPRWCEEMLKRSKMASLTIKADLEGMLFWGLESVRLAMCQGPRIREFELRASFEDIKRLLSDTDPPLRLELPMVHSFTFWAPQNRIPFNLPMCIRNSEAPHLRCLNLHNCRISWDTPLFDSLTSLTIHDLQASSLPTVDELLNSLKRMSALEVLDLKKALPSLTPGTLAVPAENKIYLSRLTDLITNSTTSECFSLISQIKVPTTARINITCSCTETTDVSFLDIMEIVGIISSQEDNGSPKKKIIRDLSVVYKFSFDLALSGWCASRLPGAQPIPDIQLRFSCSVDTSCFLDSTISNMGDIIDIEHLHDLRLSHQYRFTREMWEDTFGVLPQLANIHVAGMSAHTLIAALGEPRPKPYNDPNPTAPSIYFPKLKYLTIKACNLYYIHWPLRKCIEFRSKHTATLQSLCFRECTYINHHNVDSLKEVINVDWDGFGVSDDNVSDGDSDDSDNDDGFHSTSSDDAEILY